MSDRSLTSKSRWALPAALVALVAIFALCFIVGSHHSTGEESFAGTDSVAAEAAEANGAEPWFKPIFEPKSGEIESGLFAIQAAIGSGILFYALGRMSGKKAVCTRKSASSDSSKAKLTSAKA